MLSAMTPDEAFTPVLGHGRVLFDAGAVAANRVTARGGATIDGVAAFEPLYGQAAEGVIAVRDPHRHDLIAELVERLLEALAREGRAVVHFFLSADQGPLAAQICGSRPDARLRGAMLSLPTVART
jgi:hypothetical protein